MFHLLPAIAAAALAVRALVERTPSSPWSAQLSLSAAHLAVAESLISSASMEPSWSKRRAMLDQAKVIVDEVERLLRNAPEPKTQGEAQALQDALLQTKALKSALDVEVGLSPVVVAAGIVLVAGLGYWIWRRRQPPRPVFTARAI